MMAITLTLCKCYITYYLNNVHLDNLFVIDKPRFYYSLECGNLCMCL